MDKAQKNVLAAFRSPHFLVPLIYLVLVQKALAISLLIASFWTLPLWVLYRGANMAQTTQIFNRQLENAGLNGAKIASNEAAEMTINIARSFFAQASQTVLTSPIFSEHFIEVFGQS